jgi:acetyl esterase/lipase
MKKILLILFLLFLIGISKQLSAQRYLSEIFTGTTVTSNVKYGWNYSTLFSPVALFPDSLRADVYEPVGDTMTARPTIILLHSGSAFPIFYNYWCTGIKTDSAVAEICRQFARRGYTAIAMDYRLGWNPISTDQDIRTGSLLQALGRGVQDMKACVRYFRNNAQTVNSYHIDPNRLVIGGMNTGGTLAINYATLNSYSQIQILKFLSGTDNGIYHFTSGVTYFDSTYWGNFDGYGGDPALNNSNNTPGVSNAIQFAFSLEGAIGDSSWLHSGNVPMVAFHNMPDLGTPYYCGPISSIGQYVVDVCGGHTIIQNANGFLNNASFQNNSWTDIYTTTANQRNSGLDGLYPFTTASSQSAPWEWFDSTTVFQAMTLGLGFTIGHADTVWANAISDNPDMSRTKAIAYIDTVMGYLNPRMYRALGLNVGINEISSMSELISVYPNPATSQITVNLENISSLAKAMELFDISGRMVYSLQEINHQVMTINTKSFEAGVYSLKISFENGNVVKKITIQ